MKGSDALAEFVIAEVERRTEAAPGSSYHNASPIAKPAVPTSTPKPGEQRLADQPITATPGLMS